MAVLEGLVDPEAQEEEPFWENQYDAALKLRDLYRRCDRESKAIAEAAFKKAYTKAMAERYIQIPIQVREEMSVEISEDGWEFNTEI